MQHDAPVHLPVFGDLDLRTLSLPAFTLVLAGLDSFNPCAFFVLLFLLSLLVHARSRSRMLLIVGIFSFTLGARRLGEHSGRLLKLLAGLMMLELGLVLVMAPSLLNSAGVALLLLCVALLLTWIAARCYRIKLP